MNSKRDIVIKKPIRGTLLMMAIIMIVVVMIIVSLMSSILVIRYSHVRNNRNLSDIISYIEDHIDADDLYNCKMTGTTSDKYNESQQFLNELIDGFSDIAYIYIVDPNNGVMTNVISATSQEERDRGETDMPLLATTDAYSDEELARYVSFWKSDKTNYFEETSDYGSFYTSCKPLKNSSGETFALICVDLDVSSVHKNIILMVMVIAFAILFACVIFAVALWIVLRKLVTGPIIELEKSVSLFTKESNDYADIEKMEYQAPSINTQNEVESLAIAIDNMTKTIIEKTKENIQAARREQEYESSLNLALREANIDALTGVKNKHAYIDMEAQLNQEIEFNPNLKFGIVICDINGLKVVNDSSGHNSGDEYIKSACKVICDVFKRSPVFRVGGDEFVVIVQGDDYDNIEELVAKVKDCNKRNKFTDEIIIACGYAKYTNDKNVLSVFNKADAEMYKNKREIKNGK